MEPLENQDKDTFNRILAQSEMYFDTIADRITPLIDNATDNEDVLAILFALVGLIKACPACQDEGIREFIKYWIDLEVGV